VSTVSLPPGGSTLLDPAQSPAEPVRRPWWRRWLARAGRLVAPADQPLWARGALFGFTGLASFFYAWRSAGYLEIYYAAAVRSMSANWHDFLYAAFDPAGTISTDKLPGAFWVQALSVRLFGLHDWAIVLPQIVEGALTVLVLYHLVRRLAGPVAAVVAAGVLAVSPANVTLDRGNISDTLMILLVVLAADAVVGAVTTGHWRSLVLAACWVGLAFQAKMLEAWLLVPALGLVYLVAGPGRLLRRSMGIALFGALTVAVSLSWMVYVSAQPPGSRPYVDGSQHDSLFEQVFDYNGFGRLDHASPNAVLFQTIGIGQLASTPPGWSRMVRGVFGRDTGWLIPPALGALVFGLAARGKRSRRDRLRASLLLWGTWLLVLIAVFSVSTTVNSYYTAALTPALAGLVGTGVVLAWEHRHQRMVRLLAALGALGTALYAAWLLPPAGTGLPGWLVPVTLAAGGVAAGALVASLWVRPPQLLGAALGFAVAAALVVPTTASATAVLNRMGSFDTPFEPPAYAQAMQRLFGSEVRQGATRLLAVLEHLQEQFHTKDLMATQTAVVAAPTIFASGQEVYPLGGYNGTGVAPTLGRLKRLVDQGYFRLVLASGSSHDPRYRWIGRHCLAVHGRAPIGDLGIYFCSPPAGSSRPAG
jgi:4-amino-4-deoxy-L-arabinose transferase-like glycosyltransferase